MFYLLALYSIIRLNINFNECDHKSYKACALTILQQRTNWLLGATSETL